MKYNDYSIQDFANDSFFIRWVKNPDEESDWFWKSFIKENPECSSTIEKARDLVSLFDFPLHDLSEKDVSSMRNNLLMALRADREEHKEHRFRQTKSLGKTGRRWLQLAAAIIIIPMIYSLVLLFDGPFSFFGTGQIVLKENRVNPVGQKSVLLLSDGTKVWLNAASKLSYSKDFSEENTRDVYLEGEAFFDVAHNEVKPFIVHTSSIKIKVLGTSFNVKSYSEEKTIETTLVKGKVRIEQSDIRGNRIGDVELKPNQCAVFNKRSKIINIKEVETDNRLSWKRERLVFDEESIDNVILQMERWFNVEIHVENRGSLDCKLTANIQEESLDEVLKLIETTHNIHYSIIGNQVFIEGKLCETKNE